MKKKPRPYAGSRIVSLRLQREDEAHLRAILKAKKAPNQSEAVRKGLECLAGCGDAA